mgnify:CR=1 FL=1
MNTLSHFQIRLQIIFLAILILMIISELVIFYYVYPDDEPIDFRQLYKNCSGLITGEVFIMDCVRDSNCDIKGSYSEGFSCSSKHTDQAYEAIYMSWSIIFGFAVVAVFIIEFVIWYRRRPVANYIRVNQHPSV